MFGESLHDARRRVDRTMELIGLFRDQEDRLKDKVRSQAKEIKKLRAELIKQVRASGVVFDTSLNLEIDE